MSILLSVRDLTAGYGGVPIIEGIGLDVAEHEIAVIIGPNGAGKSTLLKSIFALTRVTAGTITFAGRDITARANARACADGHCRRAAEPQRLPDIDGG